MLQVRKMELSEEKLVLQRMLQRVLQLLLQLMVHPPLLMDT